MYFKSFIRQFSIKTDKEILPRSVVRKFKSKKSKQSEITNSTESTKKEEKSAEKSLYRVNHVNIQMLSAGLYKQLFKPSDDIEIPKDVLVECYKNFEKHEININNIKPVPDVNFELPKLEGDTLEEHFYNIGEAQCKPYRELVTNILLKGIPEKPDVWLLKSGWTRYVPGEKPESVDCPIEDCIIFDVEVCMNEGFLPTLATAVTDRAWYAWISDSLEPKIGGAPLMHNYHNLVSDDYVDGKDNFDNLIPMESTSENCGRNIAETDLKTPRVVIGHNVSYDRSRVKEQYWIDRTGTRFLDLMSMHVCVSGVTSYQRAVLKSGKFDDEDEKWLNCSSLNSLVDVYKLYCGGELDKETREIFIKGTLTDIRENFQRLVSYCANDVSASFQILKKLFPLFLERFPHPVTFAGMLELGTAYLPVNSNWNSYINSAESTFDHLENETKVLLSKKANEVCKLMKDAKYKEDLWMWDQDWSTKKITKNMSEVEKRFALLPAWYRKLCRRPDPNDQAWIPEPNISTSMRITPKLLRLTWEGYPLHYLDGYGWGFLVPFSADLDQAENIPLKQLIEKCPIKLADKEMILNLNLGHLCKDVQENLARKEYYSKKKVDKTQGVYQGSGVWCNVILDNCCFFIKLPHKDGSSYRVGNPLAKDFLTKFSENVLAGDDETTEKILQIGRMLTYWRNNRERILNQFIVWLPVEDLPEEIQVSDTMKYGAIIPQVVVCGTLTRRAVEPTWMTASNAHVERIGSELRAFVQAPPKYNIVGADVDSQELWIASVIGDADVCQMNGATPLGWMTLSGNKSSGTDMHSVTARAVGISRDHAKVINYARIYGAGQNFAERLLKQFNPSMSENEARSKAMKMFALTKGKRVYRIKDEYLEEFVDRPYNNWEAIKIAKAHGKPLGDMFHKPKWVGGTESAMFNRLEEIAQNPNPVTPFLHCRLSRALEPASMPGDRFLPTRVNWVVQSGAVDFLHLMLVSMRWLMRDKARFVLSFHDEVRYLVPERYKYDAAFAMHITNLLTRVFCVKRLGLNDLPMSVAFFTSVEVDTVLRKEASHDCVTPSNPDGLEKGYGIPKGESLNIYDTLKKCNGKFHL